MQQVHTLQILRSQEISHTHRQVLQRQFKLNAWRQVHAWDLKVFWGFRNVKKYQRKSSGGTEFILYKYHLTVWQYEGVWLWIANVISSNFSQKHWLLIQGFYLCVCVCTCALWHVSEWRSSLIQSFESVAMLTKTVHYHSRVQFPAHWSSVMLYWGTTAWNLCCYSSSLSVWRLF